jgi:succinate dehydrogenase / fumarate reductase, cytochrome b subunit
MGTMRGMGAFFTSTIGRKMLMAVTGFILSAFVLVHMLGNLHFFFGPDEINSYAHFLQTLPAPILWGFRVVIALTIALHVTMAVWLARDKAAARPEPYEVKKSLEASFASKQMWLGGLLLGGFVLFHIAHFTLHAAPVPFDEIAYNLPTEHGPIVVDDVYAMIINSFKNVWVSGLYIVAMIFLCLHLSHGFTSMFQTLGLRNEVWKKPLAILAACYGLAVFLGLAALPISVLLGLKA